MTLENNSTEQKLGVYLNWMAERGITVPHFASEMHIEKEEAHQDLTPAISDEEAIYESLDTKPELSAEDLEKESTYEPISESVDTAETKKASSADSSEATEEPNEESIEALEESMEAAEEIQKLLPQNPEKMTHPELELKFYGTLAAKILFIIDLETEAEYYPSTNMIAKISDALGYPKDQLGIAILRGHKRNKEVSSNENAYALNEIARLYNHLKNANNWDPSVVIMGSHMLSIFDSSLKFFEVNGSENYFDYLNYLVTWHPMDMAHQALLKKDCWKALQSFLK